MSPGAAAGGGGGGVGGEIKEATRVPSLSRCHTATDTLIPPPPPPTTLVCPMTLGLVSLAPPLASMLRYEALSKVATHTSRDVTFNWKEAVNI